MSPHALIGQMSVGQMGVGQVSGYRFHVPNPHSCMTKHDHVGLIEFTREALHMSLNMHVFFIH